MIFSQVITQEPWKKSRWALDEATWSTNQIIELITRNEYELFVLLIKDSALDEEKSRKCAHRFWLIPAIISVD